MSSLRTFPGSAAAQQDSKLRLCVCEDALCGLIQRMPYALETRRARWQHEIKFYDFIRQAWSTSLLLLSPSCLDGVLLHINTVFFSSLFSFLGFFLAECLSEIEIQNWDLSMCLCNCMVDDQVSFEIVSLWLNSAGCGRTGAICAIDYTWNLLKAGVCITQIPA